MATTVAVATTYYALGRLALVLAIPPGYAAAVWPAAGIGLVATLVLGRWALPGVFLGSLFVNLGVSYDGSSLTTIVQSLMIAGGPASGAALQAAFGAFVLRRSSAYPAPLDDERSALRFVLLSGPVSCVVSPTLGVGSLLLWGIIPTAEAGYTWFTWYIGDTIGVATLAPLLLIVVGKPRETWRSRRVTVGVPMMVLLASIVATVYLVGNAEQSRVQTDFQRDSEGVAHVLQTRLELNIEATQTGASLFEAQPSTDRERFRTFAEPTLARHTGIQAIEWCPRVPESQRARFEELARRDGMQDFHFTERLSDGTMRRAATRAEYYPVYYLEPLAGNEEAVGYDLGSNPNRREVLEEAVRTATPLATGRIRLVQEEGQQHGVVVFAPAYDRIDSPAPNLLGFVVTVFRMGELVSDALSRTNDNGVRLWVSDMSAPVGERLLYGEDDMPEDGLARGIGWTADHVFAGRRWRFHFVPTEAYLKDQRSWGPWGLLAGELSFSLMLTIFLLGMTGRAARVDLLVERRTEELADLVTRERTVVETVAEGILTLDSGGRIRSMNPAAQDTFQFTDQEMLEHPFVALLGGHITWEWLLVECEVSGRVELTVVRRDGSEVPVEISLTPMRLGESQAYTALTRDISQRKAIDRLKDEFLATVSHELRTPLTSILGSLGLLDGGVVGDLPKQARELVSLALSNSKSLKRLVDDLLDMETVQSGRLELKLDEVVPSDVVNRTLDTMSGMAAQACISVRQRGDFETVVRGDRDRMVQILCNLVSNAIKFSPNAEYVEVSWYPADDHGWVRFAVSDDGPGIAKDEQHLLFEPFQQLDQSTTRSQNGTGLGLAISKQLVEMHGGRIGVQSAPGEGATFWFELPTSIDQSTRL